MGFFGSSRSHVEQVEAECQAVAQHCAEIRRKCDESLRGKHEYMPPEQRADLVRESVALSRKAAAALAAAREKKSNMEQDQCPSEDLLAAESRIVAAQLDTQRAAHAVEEARQSLSEAVGEIEQFYGPRSKEAKSIRRVLADLEG